jgi:phage protein, HK97 gp10 family
MSFNITMEFTGLNETQREIEKLSTESEIKALNKKIVKRAGEIGQQEAKSQIRKKAYSKNPMKSGRKGSRTGQHAADNVPKKASTQSGNYGELIGWDRGDVSPFFYMKFHEWGTSIHKPKGFMLDAAKPTYAALKSIAEEEYERVLKEKLGG